MKKAFVLLVMLAMALTAMPVIASEPIGPPGDFAALMLPYGFVSSQFAMAVKGPAVSDFDTVAVPARFELLHARAVTQDEVLVGSGSMVCAVENSSYYNNTPMLAGLMRDNYVEGYCVIAAAKSGYTHLPDNTVARAVCA